MQIPTHSERFTTPIGVSLVTNDVIRQLIKEFPVDVFTEDDFTVHAVLVIPEIIEIVHYYNHHII